jgi:predicted nucleotidyltransferase
MKTVAEISQILQDQKPYLAERYGVAEIGISGSYVRGEQRTDSDLDILIELERPARINLVDYEIVWNTVKQVIPRVRPLLQQILVDYGENT